MLTTSKLILSSFFIACGVLLPMLFHSFGMGGPIFLPMHLPVLIGGLLLGWLPGLLIGALTPLISSLLTGMPVIFPTVPMMMVELSLYGAVGGYLYQSQKLNLRLALVLAMLVGRLGQALLLALFAESLGIKLSPLLYIATTFSNGIAGVIIQLLVIPPIVNRLKEVQNNHGEKDI